MTLAVTSRFGSYVVTALLGVGFSGEVYRCHDTVHGRDVALKILQPETGVQDKTTVDQFHQEALTMSSVRHPNIMEFYDSGIENGVYYIVSEYLEGKRLCGPIAACELIMIATQIAAGITALHNAGVVHNDVKPANLIMTPDGRVKIIDFGFAEKLTPEIAADPDRLTDWRRRVRSEQLAFGLALYELATGKGPFEDPKTAGVIAKLLASQLFTLQPESQFSMHDALRHCAAEDGSHAGLLLTAMSLAAALGGVPMPNPKF